MDNPITVNPKVMHGTPCFTGTRVPVESLFQHLKLDYSIDDFLHQFPTVRREQVEAVLGMAGERLVESVVEPVSK